MLHVIESPRGTAKRIRNDRYKIAGKTGTAQVFTVAQDAEYDEETLEKKLRDHALFIAYARPTTRRSQSPWWSKWRPWRLGGGTDRTCHHGRLPLP